MKIRKQTTQIILDIDGDGDTNRLEEFVKAALKNPKKADLNKAGELSGYEKARATATEKSIDKVDKADEGYT